MQDSIDEGEKKNPAVATDSRHVGGTAPMTARAAAVDIVAPVPHNACGNSGNPDGSDRNLSPNNNTLNIKRGGTVSSNAYGAYAESAARAAGNTVNVESGGTVNNNAYGGYVINSNGDASAKGNTAALSGGTVHAMLIGGAALSDAGSADDAGAVNNHAIVSGGRVTVNVYGGCAYSFGSGSAAAVSNDVTVSGAAAVSGDVYGGDAYSFASGSASAAGNMVTVSGGTLNGSRYIYGGYAAACSNASATGNTVTISGGTLNDSRNVYGGYVYGTGSNLAATHNAVTVSGTPVFAETFIYGGFVDGGTGDAFTGNILNKDSAAKFSFAANFEFVNFGYSGNANIGELDTTAGGTSGSAPVKLNTGGNDITFNGSLTGSGSIYKQGAGTLTLSGTNTYAGGTAVGDGTLEFKSAPPGAGNITMARGAGVKNSTGTPITVNGNTVAPGVTFAFPAITTNALLNAAAGTAFSHTLDAAGTTPVKWTLDGGSLPDGLTLSAEGVISGTPSAVGTFNFKVKAENDAGGDTKELSLTSAGGRGAADLNTLAPTGTGL